MADEGKIIRNPDTGKRYRNSDGKLHRVPEGGSTSDCECCGGGCGIVCDDLPTGLHLEFSRDGIFYVADLIGGPSCIWEGTAFDPTEQNNDIEVSIKKTEDVCGFTVSFEPIGGSSIQQDTPIGIYPDATEGFTYTGIEVS